MMTLVIENFGFECIVGILKEERTKPQKVEITANIQYEHEKHGFLDYMKVCREIKREFSANRFRLLEDAVISVCNTLKSKNPQILKINIKILKPEVRTDAKVGVAYERSFLSE